MQVRRYRPRPPLAAFVGCLWYSEGAPQTHSKERLLPNGEPAIIFNLRDGPIRLYDSQDLDRCSTYGYAVLSGARSNCFVIDADQQDRVIGVQFRPGGAFPFLRIPLSEAEDTSIALDDVWPKRAGEVRERLLASHDPQAMLLALEQCLLEQLVRPLELHPAVTFALGQFRSVRHGGRIDAVSEQIGISARRFIELFHRQVGLTPKVFCRVRRFQRVLRAVHGKNEVDWAQVALECGYYDQPHFIHDFRSFSGFTPNAYLAAATRHLNHVPLV